MLERNDRIAWNSLRYQYYSAGRIAFFHGLYSVALINLGYTIERYLNQLLLESDFDSNSPIVKKRHSINDKVKECKKRNLLNDFSTSEDFIKFIDRHFNMRYPSLIIEEMRKAYSEGKPYGIESTYIHYYDECIFQLDNIIFEYTNDHLTSTFVRAAISLSNESSKYLFYYNPFPLQSLDLYKNEVKNYVPEKQFQSLENLFNREELFNSFHFKQNNWLLIDNINSFKSSEFILKGKVKRDKIGNPQIISF